MFSRRNVLPLLMLLPLVGCARLDGRSYLRSRLHATLHARDDGDIVVAARFLELQTGRVLYAENADRAMIPASNQKLLTTAAALHCFGPDHEFVTYLKRKDDDIWIIGCGDPGVGDASIAGRRLDNGNTMTVLNDWSAALRARTSTVRDIYYYDAAFEEQITHPTWEPDDLVHWYAAPVSGLNFNNNCIDVTIFPTDPGRPVRYEVTPPVRGIEIINSCISGSTEPPAIQREQGKTVYTLSGGCTEPTRLKSKPVTDPGSFFADALRTHLESSGMQVTGNLFRAATLPVSAATIATHVTAVDELLPRINKNSQNLVAEALCKLMGREFDAMRGSPGCGTWESGTAAIELFLSRQGLDTTGATIRDGSGLSRENRVTARLITELLARMHAHQHADVFRESLAIGGIDGTIRDRFKDMPGVVYAKTGYMKGIRSLSGYAPSPHGTVAFSIIYNNIAGDVKPYEELQDEAIGLLMNFEPANPARRTRTGSRILSPDRGSKLAPHRGRPARTRASERIDWQESYWFASPPPQRAALVAGPAR